MENIGFAILDQNGTHQETKHLYQFGLANKKRFISDTAYWYLYNWYKPTNGSRT